MTLQEKLKEFTAKKRGLLAANFYNLETLHGVLKAAASRQQPVILQLTRSSLDYMGLETAVALGRTGLKQFKVEGWIHLDHGDSIELVRQCLDAGFDSVMIDGSELSFENNIRLTGEVVKLAASYGANVEAELGYVAKLGQSRVQHAFTQPAQARQFAEATGIDALAIAIGTAHGFYQEEPKLQFDLLSQIHEAVSSATLVLHGSSGLPPGSVREAINRGICKVNLATEIKDLFMRSLKSVLDNNSGIDLRKIFPAATEKVAELVETKLDLMKNETLK